MAGDEEEEVFHDEVEIEDFVYDEETETFTYPCPCGDLFSISKVSTCFSPLVFTIDCHQQEQLESGEDVARCPSCSLIVKVVYNPEEIGDLIKVKEKSSPTTVNLEKN